MPVAVRLDADGNVTGKPKKHRSYRVFVEGSSRTDGFPISDDGLRILRDDPEQRRLFARAATSFRGFLTVWNFLDQDSGTWRTLGDEIWPAQEAYIAAVEQHPWIFELKARQLGQTTIAIAYDAYVIRFRDPNARVHVFSSGDDAAKEIVDHIREGLERLPEAMRMYMETTTRSIRIDCGGDERTFVRSYASTRAASRGSTCSHLHLDEWSSQTHPRRVYQSAAPSVAQGGSFHVVTTETVGPESDTANYFRECVKGTGKHHALFVPSSARPGRGETWREAMRMSMPVSDFAKEYPESWEEALASAGDRMLTAEHIEACTVDARGLAPDRQTYMQRWRFPEKPRRKFSIGVDIGLRQDATVLTCIDCTDDIVDVVGFERLIKPSVGDVQVAIENMYRRWSPGAVVVIEDSGIGAPIREGVRVPESHCFGVLTTGQSKPRMLGDLAYLVEQSQLCFNSDEVPDLHRELLAYSTDDKALTQDCVMSLAFAVHGMKYALNPTAGRILPWKSYSIDI